MVHTDEQVEALWVDVEYPSEAGTKGANAEVDAAGEPFQGCYVGRKAEVGPGVLAVDACRVHQAEGEVPVVREDVLTGEVHGCAEACGPAADVALVLELIDGSQFIAQLVPLLAEGVGIIVINAEDVSVCVHSAMCGSLLGGRLRRSRWASSCRSRSR